MTADTKPIPKQRTRNPHLIPWIVVGLVVLVALVASTLAVQALRGSDAPEPPSATAPVEPQPEPEPEPGPVEIEPVTPEVPQVEVGDTYEVNITQWNRTIDLSLKLRGVWYLIEGENVILTAPLIEQLPESCAEMRTGFGFTQDGEEGLQVVKPDAVCTEDEQLYNEIWGLVDAAAQTSRAM